MYISPSLTKVRSFPTDKYKQKNFVNGIFKKKKKTPGFTKTRHSGIATTDTITPLSRIASAILWLQPNTVPLC